MKWWQTIFAKRRSDLDEEIQVHIEMAVQDRIDRGESAEQAHAAALREFGNIPLIRDVEAELSGRIWIERLLLDLHYAFRQLRNAPGFSLTAILTLALAIGANTAIFTLVHAILLRQVPFDDPSRVLKVDNANAAHLAYDTGSKNYRASFNDAARSFKTIEGAAMYSSSGVNVELGAGNAQRLRAAETSARLLNVLGVTPSLGRGFASDEDIPGNDHVVLVSDRLWRGALNADPSVLGRTLKINGLDYAVVGVLPSGVAFPENADLWTPTVFDVQLREAGAFFAPVLVRARAGVPIDAIRAEFGARAAASARQNGSRGAEDEKPTLTPIARELTKSIRSSLLMLTGAVCFVLLIACANVATLALVRTAERRGEFAVRAALGAARARLMQQQLAESFSIALAGGVLGVVLAYAAVHLIYGFRPAALLEFQRPDIDSAVFVFTAAMAVSTGLAFGIVPAWLAGREDPAGALKTGLWRSSAGGSRLRKMLVAAEVGIAFVLLVGAGLLLRTMANMGRVPLGYDVKGLVSFSVSLQGPPYISEETRNSALSTFYSNVLDRVAGIPGVTAAAVVSSLPLDTRADMLLPVTSENAKQNPVFAAPRFASSAYFGTMGIPIVEGREFTKQDSRTSPKVVVVTSDLAEKLWPGQNPIGHRIGCFSDCKEPPTVIGVIAPNLRLGPRSDRIAEYYMPYSQRDWPFMTFVLRTGGDPKMLASAVRRAVAAVDRALPAYDIETMRQRLDNNESLVRFELFTLSIFAMISVLLVSTGLYGVIAYTVTQRTGEIGLRIALGAQSKTILVAVVRESALITLAGIVLGLLSSLALMRLISAVLFGVTPHDPRTLATVCMLFLAVATLASYLPARRAASIDPAQTLRSE